MLPMTKTNQSTHSSIGYLRLSSQATGNSVPSNSILLARRRRAQPVKPHSSAGSLIFVGLNSRHRHRNAPSRQRHPKARWLRPFVVNTTRSLCRTPYLRLLSLSHAPLTISYTLHAHHAASAWRSPPKSLADGCVPCSLRPGTTSRNPDSRTWLICVCWFYRQCSILGGRVPQR
jgi:hypothetical protein